MRNHADLSGGKISRCAGSRVWPPLDLRLPLEILRDNTQDSNIAVLRAALLFKNLQRGETRGGAEHSIRLTKSLDSSRVRRSSARAANQ